LTDVWDRGEGSHAAPASRSTDLDLPEPTWEGERYELRSVLGFGGMGQVRVAWDRVLQREVALKEPAPGAEAARLAHEAAITARLDHPGIVPIHDLGRRPDGGTFYVMRLVRGRSLAAALGRPASSPSSRRLRSKGGGGSMASGPQADRPETPLLLRALLQVCEAVASAHQRGIVHRDLKPGNIMLGPFGEVQVVDWGLAWAPDLPVPRSESGEGTPAYMSPQQAAACPPAPTDDVFSLGRMLAEVGAGLGPELDALVARATAPRAEDRYRNAGALAADLACYLDGRRVAAYHYRPLDLLKRLVRAWRVPLGVAGVALGVLGVLALAGTHRLRLERDRAVKAEAASEEALGRVLLDQAFAAHHAGERPEAELRAAAALVRGQEADATGLLLDLAGERRVQVGAPTALPDCNTLSFSESGHFTLCLAKDGRLAVGPVAGAIRYSVAAVRQARFLGDAVVVDTLDGRLDLYGTGGQRLHNLQPVIGFKHHTSLTEVVPGSTPARFALFQHNLLALGPLRHVFPPRLLPCGEARIVGAQLTPTLLVVACSEGRVRRFDLGLLVGQAERALDPSFAPSGFAEVGHLPDASAFALGPDGGYFLGTLAGEVVAFGPQGQERGRLRTEGAVQDLQRGPAGLYVRNDDLRVRLATLDPWQWDTDLGSWRAFRAGRHGGHHTFDGTHHRALALGPRAATRFRAPAGLSTAVVEGDQIALLRGDGAFTLHDLSPRHLGDWSLGTRPLKAARRLGDRWYVVGSPPEAGLVVLDHARLERRPAAAARRLVHCRAPGCPIATLLAAAYGGGLDLHTASGTSRRPIGPLVDLSEDGYLSLDELGVVRTLDGEAQGPARPHLVALDHLGLQTALLTREEVLLEGPAQRRIVGLVAAVDVALAPDRPLVAVGLLSGHVHLYDVRTGDLRARLALHEKRVATVAFADGHLITAGWDGVARRIPLDLLDFSPSQRLALVEARWGRSAHPPTASPPPPR
jgi:hypothetical protein